LRVGPVNAETKQWLGTPAQDALRLELAESPAAARLLRRCGSLCYPPGLKAGHVERLDQLVKKFPNYDEQLLKDYLYAGRQDIERTIDFLESSSTADDFAARLKWRAEGGEIKIGPKVEDQPKFATKRSEELGVKHGKQFADTGGYTDVGYQNPFEATGGQGIDDVRVKGLDVYKDEVWVIDYKGGIAGRGAVIEGQLELDWVVGNIRKLYLEGGAQGQKWAMDLARALREGRLRGMKIGTVVDRGAVGATTVQKTWTYPPLPLQLY
jgi:hypothetical protein